MKYILLVSVLLLTSCVEVGVKPEQNSIVHCNYTCNSSVSGVITCIPSSCTGE